MASHCSFAGQCIMTQWCRYTTHQKQLMCTDGKIHYLLFAPVGAMSSARKAPQPQTESYSFYWMQYILAHFIKLIRDCKNDESSCFSHGSFSAEGDTSCILMVPLVSRSQLHRINWKDEYKWSGRVRRSVFFFFFSARRNFENCGVSQLKIILLNNMTD